MQEYQIRVPRRKTGVRIIRARHAEQVDAFNFEDFSESVEKIDESPQEAEEQTSHAEQVSREQLELDLKAAYDRGFNDGKDVAGGMLEREMQQREEWLRRFDEIAAQLHQQFRRELNGIDQSTVELSVKIAEHILGREIGRGAYDILEQAGRALEAAHGADEVTIRIHPDDYEALETAKSTLLDEHSGLRSIKVLADKSVRLAGCILETSIGTIDAQLHTQLEELSADLTRAAGDAVQHDELLEDLGDERPNDETSDDLPSTPPIH